MSDPAAPRLIVFDVDSTLLAVESLDHAIAQAAEIAGRGEEVARAAAEATAAGMSGASDFRTSLERRLALLPLTRPVVEDVAQALCASITPGMGALVSALRARGDHVRAVSGGFGDLIAPALAGIGFEASDIRANRFIYEDDTVVDFDRAIPLSRNGGKPVIVSALKEETGVAHAVMVGDGVTDLEAYEAGAADAFIGFGAVARRESVAERAEQFAMSVEELSGFLGLSA